MQSKSVQLRSAAVYAGQERELHGDAIRAPEAQLASSNIAIYPVDLHRLLGGTNTTYNGHYDTDLHGAGLANQAISQGASLQASQRYGLIFAN